MKETQPISCLGKVAFHSEKDAENKAIHVSKKFKLQYSVYKCAWCTKTNLQDTYHLATIKNGKKKNYKYVQYLEYYRKPIVVQHKRPPFLTRLYRAIKHSYKSFIFHIK